MLPGEAGFVEVGWLPNFPGTKAPLLPIYPLATFGLLGGWSYGLYATYGMQGEAAWPWIILFVVIAIIACVAVLVGLIVLGMRIAKTVREGDSWQLTKEFLKARKQNFCPTIQLVDGKTDLRS